MSAELLPDYDYTTPSGALDSDEHIARIGDELRRQREFEKKHRHPDVHVIYSFEDVPRKNLRYYYYKSLEAAVVHKIPKIIIEPSTLGVRVGQYLNIGYYMHWACIGTGLMAIVLGLTFRHKTYTIYSFAISSCVLLHACNLYYRNLPLAYYKYVRSGEMQDCVEMLNPKVTLVTDCPIVLVPYNPMRRRVFHNIVGCAAGIMMLTLVIRGLPPMLCRCSDGVIPNVVRYEGNLFEFF